MSLRRENTVPQEHLKVLIGKTIQSVIQDVNETGYGFVAIALTDGTQFTIREYSQSGEIETFFGR